MDYWQMLREIIDSSDMSLSQVSREIGKSRSFLSVAFHDRKKLRIDLFCRVLEVCGYRMTLSGRGNRYEVRPMWYESGGYEPIWPDEGPADPRERDAHTAAPGAVTVDVDPN